MIVATAGHVDHGKTSLVHALTGIDTDTLAEEKSRGLTIDLGFAYADIEDERIGFIDVPGHARFVPNLLAGVSILDMALLIVAADDGIMPQTREHLDILDLLEIDRVDVVITRIDLTPPDRIEQTARALQALLGTTRFGSARQFQVSTVTSRGLAELAAHLACVSRVLPSRDDGGRFRLAIDRCFTVKGAGTVVTGSVFSGHIDVGDEVMLLPSALKARIRGLHRQNEVAASGRAGDRLALNISSPGLDRQQVRRGQWVAASAMPTTQRADVLLRVLPHGKAIAHMTPVHIHSAADHVTGRVALLDRSSVSPGEQGFAQLRFDEPVTLWSGDRMILRDQSASFTLAGARVLDPFAAPKRRQGPNRTALLHARLAPDVTARLQACLAAAPGGFDFEAFRLAQNLTESDCQALEAATGVIRVDERCIVTAGAWKTCQASIEALVTRNGASADTLRSSLMADYRAEVIDAALGDLVKSGRLRHEGGRYLTAGDDAPLTESERELFERVRSQLAQSPKSPPVVPELANRLGLSPTPLDKFLRKLTKARLLVNPIPRRFFLPHAYAALRQDAVTLHEREGPFTVAAFRDESGVGRNLAVEILEHFDRSGITQRAGDVRRVRQPDPNNKGQSI